MKHLFTKYLRIALLACPALLSPVSAQYISRSEPVPYVCPMVCQGGTTVLKVSQVENIAGNPTVQALLSNAGGSFASGTQTLEATRYSTNRGGTWLPGPYRYSGNISDLYLEITIPLATPPGNGYKVRIKVSSGYASPDVYQCPGSGITVTPYVPPLPQVPQNTYGEGQWTGHVYTWTATTNSVLNTPALINDQNFFSSSNYKGHVLYNPLSFDMVLSTTGGLPGTTHNGTSISCGVSYSVDYSMRLLRREQFSPGYYQLSIQGDDGVRLSIDGGGTWLLDSFLEQEYSDSYKTTATSHPNGICLGGSTDLVIEYFQRPADARITFTATLLSGGGSFSQPLDQTICSGDDVAFSVGNPTPGSTYQWEVSTNGGSSYSPLSNGAPYSNVGTPVLNINGVPDSFDGYLYRCVIGGTCGGSINSQAAGLTVTPLPAITLQPGDQPYCNGENIVFSIVASGSPGSTYQWQMSTDNGATYTNVPAGGPYSGSATAVLTISPATSSLVGNRYRCIVSACGVNMPSEPATVLPGGDITLQEQPAGQTVCAGIPVTFSVTAAGSSGYQWQLNDGTGFTGLANGNNISGATTPQLTISTSGMPPGTVWLRCVLSGGCFGPVFSEEAALIILPATAIAGSISVPTPVCPGDLLQYHLQGSNGDEYRWQLDSGNGYQDVPEGNGFSGTASEILNIHNVPASLQMTSLRCRITGGCGMVFTEPVTIYLRTVPAIIRQPVAPAACSGSLLSIAAEVAGEGLEYAWEIRSADGSYTPLENNDLFKGTHTPNLSVQGVNELHGTVLRCRITGCGEQLLTDTVRLTIAENGPVFIPNAFSPDGDFINSHFKLYTEGSPILQGSVYNRWGELLFNWDSASDGWDGTYLGRDVPEGVYVYRIIVETACETFMRTGTVTLFR